MFTVILLILTSWYLISVQVQLAAQALQPVQWLFHSPPVRQAEQRTSTHLSRPFSRL